ncbi:hypothetical protein [Nitratidesulfovibrio oxamicus]|nr:hypothetical protein [Nitratidesulfovibrio oxamicus]
MSHNAPTNKTWEICFALLLAAAYAYILAVFITNQHYRGPYWYFFNADPSYAFLIGSLGLANLDGTHFTYHPGITPQLIGAAVLRIAHSLQFENTNIVVSVISKPEKYIYCISLTLLALYMITHATLAFYTKKHFKCDLLLQLCILATPFVNKYPVTDIGGSEFYGFTCESTTPFLMNLLLLIILATYHRLTTKDSTAKNTAAISGVLATIGTLNKITLAPIMAFTFFIQRNPNAKKKWAIAAAATFCTIGLPLLLNINIFIEFIDTISKGSGLYGSGPQTFVSLDNIIDNATAYATNYYTEAFITAIATLTICISRNTTKRTELTILTYITLAQIITTLLVIKHYQPRYLFPLNHTTPLLLYFSHKILHEKISPKFATSASLILLTLFPTFSIPKTFQHQNRTSTEAQDITDIYNIINSNPDIRSSQHIYPLNNSSQANALAFGNAWARTPFAKTISEAHPETLYYIYGDFYSLVGQKVETANIRGDLYIFGPTLHLKNGDLKKLNIDVIYRNSSQFIAKLSTPLNSPAPEINGTEK